MVAGRRSASQRAPVRGMSGERTGRPRPDGTAGGRRRQDVSVQRRQGTEVGEVCGPALPRVARAPASWAEEVLQLLCAASPALARCAAWKGHNPSPFSSSSPMERRRCCSAQAAMVATPWPMATSSHFLTRGAAARRRTNSRCTGEARTAVFGPLKKICFLYGCKVFDESPRKISGMIDLYKPYDLQPGSVISIFPDEEKKVDTTNCIHDLSFLVFILNCFRYVDSESNRWGCSGLPPHIWCRGTRLVAEAIFRFAYVRRAEAAANGTVPRATLAAANGTVAGEETECSHVGSVEPDQSVMAIVKLLPCGGVNGGDGQADTAQLIGKVDPHSPGWTKSDNMALKCHHPAEPACWAGSAANPNETKAQ